jgi:NAD(P)-dependent dehydrogenase (short-subunit alcohol dehydrogenase family)
MGRTVFITGSSSGIGWATAKLFAERGWNVAATVRDQASLLPFDSAPNLLKLYLELSDENSIERSVTSALRRFGSIDVLVNNAGFGVFGPLEGITSGQFMHQLQVNVVGPAMVIQKVLPGMRQRRTGIIVNISSLAGRVAVPFQAAYHASKFALEGMSESLRYELKPHNIRVKLIEPARCKTDFASRSLQWVKHQAYEPQLTNVVNRISLDDQTAGSCAQVAETIFKAATDTSDCLRYPVGGHWFRLSHVLSPDAVWHRVVYQLLSGRTDGDCAGARG